MSRRKYKKGTCPNCKSYNASKEEIEEHLHKMTCADCHFIYTLQVSPMSVSEQNEKAGQLQLDTTDAPVKMNK